jgi:UDP-glucose:(heptosyl)LPS alpha-1,3-glucosyltransferase
MTANMRKQRFATAIRDFSKRKGGAERYLVDLCTQMARDGDEVHVYTERWDEELDGIHFHRIKPFPFPKSLRLLSFALRASHDMGQGGYDTTLSVGNTTRADVLQPHGGVHWAWFWRSLRAYENPFFWTAKFLGRVLSLKQWVSGWIEDTSYRRGNLPRIIAISDMVKHDMIQWYQIPEDRVAVIYNGVNLEQFHPRNGRYREEIRKKHGVGEEVLLLFVSNNFRMKGLGILMEVLADLKKEGGPPVKLLIVGRDRKGSYSRLVERLGIFEEIVFAGSTNEIEKYYGAADLLVHPSFYDACSLTVFEALASGLPVITTSSNGASGILTQGKEGFILFDPRDRQALKRQISFFFDPETRQRASIAARSLAEHYSVERNYREMNDILRQDDSKREARG